MNEIITKLFSSLHQGLGKRLKLFINKKFPGRVVSLENIEHWIVVESKEKLIMQKTFLKSTHLNRYYRKL